MIKVNTPNCNFKIPIILIVDDIRSNQEILVSLLGQDYQVKVAGNGYRALDIAQRSPRPDLILLDINMPDMNGYDVFKELKDNRLTSDIPVIFVTAATDSESEVHALQMGAVDYMTKPISPAITLLRVKNQLLIRHSLDKLNLASIVFENAMESIMVTDAQVNILDTNPAFTRMTGYSHEEVSGENPRFLKSGYHDQSFYEAMWQSIISTGHWSGEIWNRNKAGELYPELRSISAITDTQGVVTHYVGISSDISMLKQHEEQLEYLAHYDALTSIPNRVLLADRMKQAIAQAKRERTMLGVCYLDIDGFKPVNDNFGHQVGDYVLIEIAQRIGKILREGDTVARLGGDEFVVLLPDLNHLEECIVTLKRIHEAVAMPIFIDEQLVSLTTSIGVSIFPSDNKDSDELLRHADQAMYVAKQSGKNRFHFFDPMYDQQHQAYHEAMLRIQQGLVNDEFELYYQPIVDLSTRQVVGAEALIRWNHPERGLLLPGVFLNDIRNSELEIRVGEWVIDSALSRLMQWSKKGFSVSVSVNIAACHLQSDNFLNFLEQAFMRYPDLPAGRLHIEILETAALEDVATVAATIKACRVLGVFFSLDDFGTGYSSLTYLHHLPVDTIKIDQTFVRDMLVDKGDNAIVKGVIALSKAFEISMVAEGIESMEHFHALYALGCEYGQGYAIARPMPAALFYDKYSQDHEIN